MKIGIWLGTMCHDFGKKEKKSMLEFVKLNVKKCDASIIDQIPFWDATERESLLEFIKLNIKKGEKVWV